VRRIGRVDIHQAEIVAALRAVGASVQVLSTVGGGCPDLMAGFRGATYCIEVKTVTGKRDPKPEPLTPDQERWHAHWRGHVAVVSTADEAFAAIGAVVR
jgi:hypothetical protein